MSPTPTYEVEGGRELRATLRQAGDDLQDLKNAHNSAAQIAAQAASALAPKKTGRLADTVRGSGTQSSALIRAGYKSVPYAGPIHYGWPARNISANLFMLKAARSTEPRWLPIYQAAIESVLAKVKGI